MAESDTNMLKCSNCDYYYPDAELNEHNSLCVISDRFECPVCNCDYLSVNINDAQHITECIGLENKIQFICEYSKRLYLQSSIRQLVYLMDDNPTGREILRTINADDFNLYDWISNENVETFECPICFRILPKYDLFIPFCNESHKHCYNCLYNNCMLKLKNNEPLTCPMNDCNSQIEVNELQLMPFPRYVVRKLVEKYNNQLFNGYLEKTKGAIRCPNSNCNWAVVSDVVEKIKMDCGNCKKEFCSICRGMWHFDTNCNDLPKIMQDWTMWCTEGRSARSGSVEDIEQNVRVIEQNEALKRNFEQLKNDEEYKLKNCKLCPRCSRVLEKLSGCDLMVCGTNYHGGDVQNGCGHQFNWITDAQPYISKMNFNLDAEKFNSESLPKESRYHYPHKCSKCSGDIYGIRFQCVNCESVNFCEKCEIEGTLEHEANHLFRLIY